MTTSVDSPQVGPSPSIATVTPAALFDDLFSSPRKPRNYKQWEEAARRNTERIKTDGSPAPLVWVLVKGKNIPGNAIVAGLENRQPLYIARTFYEGSLCVGKAGRHLKSGASIPFNGEEVHVDTYEVLVPAFNPVIRYQLSDDTKMPAIPRIASEQPAQPSDDLSPLLPGAERINLIKIAILIDDSASMAEGRWEAAREALAGIVGLNSQLSVEGVDLFFMNDQRHTIGAKDPNEVRHIFDCVNPRGETPIGAALGPLFDRYISSLEDSTKEHRPVTLVVVTDGEPTDEPESVIVNAARRLEQSQVPQSHFNLQFVQIGDDPDATDFLAELDDDLYRDNNCWDIVDSTPFDPENPGFTMQNILTILLRSVDRNKLQKGPDKPVSEGVPVESEGAPAESEAAEAQSDGVQN